MISFDYAEGIDSQESFPIRSEKILADTKKIPELLKKIHARNQGFYSDEVLHNEDLISDMKAYADSKSEMEYVVVLGIGGSALGGIALQNSLAPDTKKKIFFLDNIGPENIQKICDTIDIKKTLFLVITKSGGTVETLSQYIYFQEKVIQAEEKISDHFCFVTGPTGFLAEESKKLEITTFPVPITVGGRFSVLTPVGILPALFMGIDVDKLFLGANEGKNRFLSEGDDNIAFQYALIQYELLKNNVSKNVMYAYANRLFYMADWYRQLLAESTGKKLNNTGEEVFTGIMPINARGVTDHHSQNQLYLEGPKDTLIVFLQTQYFETDIKIPDLSSYKGEKEISFVAGKSFGELLNAERDAAKKSLSQSNRPWVTISLPVIDSFHIGELFLFLEASMAFLGEMMEINAFDQPGVEQTKILTKEILATQ